MVPALTFVNRTETVYSTQFPICRSFEFMNMAIGLVGEPRLDH